MDFLRNALSSTTALLILAVTLIAIAFALSLADISTALTILVAIVGLVFLLVWFMQSRMHS